MNKRYCYLVGAGLLLAGCHAAPEKTTSGPAGLRPAAPAAPVARAAATLAAAPATLPFTGYHRYRGTVGGLPVTVELLVDSAEAFEPRGLRCRGHYFYERRAGGDLELTAPAPYQPEQVLRLTEGPGGTWQASQPLGPLLNGTWRSTKGQQLPFALREDYRDAVRYEVLTSIARGNTCPPDGDGPQFAAWAPYAELTQEYLHLLGPDTLRPALWRLQCPPPARRRSLTRKAAHHNDRDCTDTSRGVRVWLNAYGLLAVSASEYVNEYNGSRPHATDRSRLYDLRAGRWLPLAELLRPSADSLLEKLVGRHLLHDPDQLPQRRQDFYWYNQDSTNVQLPRGGVIFTSQGVFLLYDPGEVAHENYGPVEVSVPYPELLPLLRPTSPVARMLRERGLWHPAKVR